MEQENTRRIICRVSPETYTTIESLSHDLGISKGKVIDEMVKAYVEQCEKEQD